MKQIAALFMTLVLICSFALPISAASATGEADALNALGLFKGTEKGYELEKSLTRTEAVVLLVRMLGKEETAEACGKTHPFLDVASWADGYISYAHKMGLTNGISETHFGAEDAVESNMYITFLLRALRYADGENADFIWQMPYALAGDLEMLPMGIDLVNFTRKDAVIVTSAALFAKEKGKESTLSQKLIAEGVFSEEEWLSAFPEDPFRFYKKVNDGVGKALPFHTVENNHHHFYNYLLLEAEEKEDGIYAYVLQSHADYLVREGNEIGSRGSGAGAMLVVLERNTCALVSSENTVVRDNLFPKSAYGTEANNLVWKGMNTVLGKKVDPAIEGGILAWRQPTYDEYMETLKNDGMNYITGTYETEYCTILSGYLGGTPHGSFSWVRLVYKEGSPLGDGKVISLPLPDMTWGKPASLEGIIISEDGKTATYSFFFESDLILEAGTPSEIMVHQAGTYQYTTDLATGETALEIIK